MKPLKFFAHPLATLSPRDLMLLELLPIKDSAAALEIGTGSGSSLFRLADAFSSLHGIDVARDCVRRLQSAVDRFGRRFRDVRLFTLDFCAPDAADQLPTRYDVIYACDTLEHVPDPEAFLGNVYQALKPGGEVLITFPNEHPSRAHGITYFERRDQLEDLLHVAGFKPEDVRVEVVELRRAPDWVFRAAWNTPRRFAKKTLRFLKGTRGPSPLPQTFEETDFFRLAGKLEGLAPLINGYCWLVMKLMSLGRSVYKVRPAPDVIWDTHILIRARRAAEVPTAAEEQSRKAVSPGRQLSASSV